MRERLERVDVLDRARERLGEDADEDAEGVDAAKAQVIGGGEGTGVRAHDAPGEDARGAAEGDHLRDRDVLQTLGARQHPVPGGHGRQGPPARDGLWQGSRQERRGETYKRHLDR